MMISAAAAQHCPLCGQKNIPCTGNNQCWCMGYTIPKALLERIPLELRNKACICQACVVAFNQAQVP